MNNPKTIYLDASAFKESACIKKLGFLIHDGLRSKKEESWFAFGTAFHKFRADIRSRVSVNLALASAINLYSPFAEKFLDEKDFRTIPNLTKACLSYYNQVFMADLLIPLQDADKKPLLEQKFAIECWKIFPALEALCEKYNIILLLSGTIDEIGSYLDRILIVDAKTSSQFYVAEELGKYSRSVQMMFYKMMVEHQFKLKDVGAMIDGVFFTKKKDTIDIAFQRSEIHEYDDKMMSHFKRQLEDTCVELITAVSTGFWKENIIACLSSTFSSGAKVGKCPFYDVCASPDEEIREHRLKRDFKVVDYNPLKFDDMNQE